MIRIPKWTSISIVFCAITALAACDNAAELKAKYLERGKSLYEAGDFTKARLELKNALKIDPKDSNAQFVLAEVQESLQNWREAVGGYQQVIELAPDHVAARVRLAQIYLRAGMLDQVTKLVDEAAKLDRKNPDIDTLRGAVHAKQGDLAAAIKDAKAALALNATHVDAIMLLSSLYVNGDRADDAAALLKGGIEAHPGNLALHLALADVYNRQQKSVEASGQLKEIIHLDPDNLAHRVRLANYYAALGKVAEAEQVLRQAVADHADSGPAKLALVKFIDEKHGRKDAERELLAFIDQSPKDETLRFGLAGLYQEAGDLDKAEAVYREIIKRDDVSPKGLEARTRLARVLIKRDKVQDAQTVLNEVLKESPSDNDALILRGSIALAKKDAIDAIADFRAVLKEQPDSAKVMQLLAAAHILNGEVDLARDQLQRAVQLSPKDQTLRLQFAQVLAGRKDGTDQAIEQIHLILKDSPHNRDALNSLFNMQMAKRDWPAALVTAKLIKKDFPDDAAGAYQLGTAYQANKQFDAALGEFRGAVEKNPQAIEPLTALVKTFLAQGRPNDALQWLDKVVKQVPKHAVAYNLEGEVLLSEKKFDRSIQFFRKAIAIQPKWDTPYNDLAAAYLAQNDVEQAIRAYKDGIGATAYSQHLVLNLASLYEGRGDHDTAIDQYKELLAKDPSSVEAANNLAMMLVTYKGDASNLAKAKDLVQRLENSTNPAYLDTLGWVRYKSGEFDTAVAALEQALQGAPDSKLLRYHLGMAQYAKGETQAARRNLRQALEGDPKFYGLAEAKATLDKLAKM